MKLKSWEEVALYAEKHRERMPAYAALQVRCDRGLQQHTLDIDGPLTGFFGDDPRTSFGTSAECVVALGLIAAMVKTGDL